MNIAARLRRVRIEIERILLTLTLMSLDALHKFDFNDYYVKLFDLICSARFIWSERVFYWIALSKEKK